MNFFKISYIWQGKSMHSLVYPGIHRGSTDYEVLLPDGSFQRIIMEENMKWTQFDHAPAKLIKIIGEAIVHHYAVCSEKQRAQKIRLLATREEM